MNKKQLFQNLKGDVYCRIKKSKISGVGVFAIREIPKGTWPFQTCQVCKQYSFSKSELKKIPKEVATYAKDMCQCCKGNYLIPACGLNNIDISFFVNHSKKPNLGIVEGMENFITLRNIKSGEELTVDYTLYSEEDWIK